MFSLEESLCLGDQYKTIYVLLSKLPSLRILSVNCKTFSEINECPFTIFLPLQSESVELSFGSLGVKILTDKITCLHFSPALFLEL